MSETESETDQSVPTGQAEECQRCGRKQGLVGKYDIWLCRQCFREIARDMGFEKYS
ncbi:30S ribosomal protein S14 [Halobacteriales archaeon SW_8_65_20]|nr:MAG: 30S ribosomal protein S14 [Halobacteriales archaeon QH_7_65_31]PSQ30180.1 MAG: 30S ribosomal protein S14 [Halobacteriales archaeon SW_6_65_46]PSQ51788.1 MAG: 30S ribosomal protein S14 [Halobacteriales archaeon SW_8_65_20]